MGKINICNKEYILKEGLKIDKTVSTVETEGDTRPIENEFYRITPYEKRTELKTNIGKGINEGFNLGATPEDVQCTLQNIYDTLGVKLIKHNSIEYCIDIVVLYKIKDNQNIFNTFDGMLQDNSFRERVTTTLSDAKGKVSRTRALKDTVGIKGKKSRAALKMYSKLEEKNLSKYVTWDIIRVELVLYSRELEKYGIDNLENIEPVKKALRGYFKCWERQLPLRNNRHTKKTRELIQVLFKQLE